MQFNLTLSPPQIEFIVKPGGGFTQAYDVVNNSPDTLFLKTSVEPFVPSGTNGAVSYDNALNNPNLVFSLANADIQMGQTFKLAPNSKQQLVLKVKTAADYQGDAYYTFFVTQDPNSTASDSPAATARLGSHLLLSLSPHPQTTISATVSQFSTTPFFKDVFFTPITFNAITDNTGNFYFKTKGTITITKNGLPFKTINLYPHNVLAHHSRQISCFSPESSVQNQESNIPVPCTLQPPFWPGVYTATISIDGSQPSASSTIQFFVFPYYITLFVLALIMFITLVLRRKHSI